MNAPQGLFSYPGISPDDVRSGSFTITHGIGPSVCTLYCYPRGSAILKYGTLTITYGSTVLTFPDCAADKLTRQIARDGREVWAVPIYDRRWKWKFGGRVSGFYNVRRDCIVSAAVAGRELGKRNSTMIVPGTEKTPRELAKLCLEAMGEERFDVSAMPDETRPEIAWNYTLPAEALAQLADSVGCRVVLRLNNTVAILPSGEGERLPFDHLVVEGGTDLDSPERPDKLVVVSSPIKYQGNFDLEAVGRDTDDSIRPIDELTYRPEGGWGALDVADCSTITDAKARVYAKESVFRWYRIKPPFRLPGLKYAVGDLDSVLPISDKQVETWTVDAVLSDGTTAKRLEPKPAWVYGIYLSDRMTAMQSDDEKRAKAEDAKIDDDTRAKPQTLYLGSYTIDRETGIVKFGEPVYLVSKHEPESGKFAGGQVVPAKLRLRTAVMLRDPKTRGWVCHEFARTLDGPKAGTRPRYIVRADMEVSHWYELNHSTKSLDAKSNLEECEAQARYYLDSAEREYQFTDPGTIEYAGIRPINPDGAIQQVTWWVDDGGYAFTRASRNREEITVVPSYAEKRANDRMQAEAERAARTARQQRMEQERSRA